MFSSSEGSGPGSPSLNDVLVVEDESADTVTYHSLHPNPILGCKHYMRNCRKLSNCCGKWYTCRFCHDEQEDHQVDRFKTMQMMCMHCQTQQAVGQICANEFCAKEIARYFCEVCRFWDNDPDKKIYHCDQCGICRIGNKEDFSHCDKCNACITTEFHPKHKCIERSLECDCVICGEYLFTSTSPVMFMPCGHSIHFLCHREHMRTSYQCPVCWKSLGDMKQYFKQIDVLLEGQKMPQEYALVRSHVLCNDCEQKSVARFHFVYHKCKPCESYNTKVIKTFTVKDEDEEGEVPVEMPAGGTDSNDNTM